MTMNILISLSGDPSLERHLLIPPNCCIFSQPSLGPRTDVAKHLLLSSPGEVVSGRVETTVFLGVTLDGDNVVVTGVSGHDHLGMCDGLLCRQASRHLLFHGLSYLRVPVLLNGQGLLAAFNR